jgi:hypothetical protein
MKKLKAEGVAVSALSQTTIADMFRLFSQYYSNIDFVQFQEDLQHKDHVFLLKDRKDNSIQGFSTLVGLETEVSGKRIRGMFSGDTVVHEDYWGQGTLGVAFLKHLFLAKLKKPFTPLYWFLISKGYKTYLLMANNFPVHYPRHEQSTPAPMQQIIDAFGHTLYPEHYHAESGIIQFSHQQLKTKDCLKAEVTPITSDMCAGNQRIAFFAEQNPHWEKGDELACIAEMTFAMPFAYALKTFKKRGKRRSTAGQEKQSPAGNPSYER